ncbi:MAG: translation initiation factor IF-2 [Spartobacteria bacterium]|nr:translation initiation factor IF-2 [Spartobacteria bacterium]
MKVYELAEEFDMVCGDLLEEIRELGIDSKTAQSNLTPKQVKKITVALFGDTMPDVMNKSKNATGSEPVAPAVDDIVVEPEEPEEPEEPSMTIVGAGPFTVKEFAEKMRMKPNKIIAELMMMNIFASINESIDFKIAGKIAAKHGFTVVKPEAPKPVAPKPEAPRPAMAKPAPAPKAQKTSAPAAPEVTQKAPEETRDASASEPVAKPEPVVVPKKKKKKKVKGDAASTPLGDREIVAPPIVTFMGHVDHGKTSLLDRIRNAKVASGEAGGITQHIGAYTIEYNEHPITFLDTPGHAAFTAMRARGANLTDIVVLVVAADDGVMPQTREAIQHAKAAGVTIIVALNKWDLIGVQRNKDRILTQLQSEGLMCEEWGGETAVIPVSAHTGDGLDDLLERMLLEAEMLELRADPGKSGEGFVVEAQMEPGMGPTASLLVRDGTLSVGDAIVCGASWGRIKSLINDRGIRVRKAGPSSAVKCLGLVNVPDAGAMFEVFKNDKDARRIAEERQAQERKEDLTPQKLSIDDWLGTTIDGTKELSVLLKADVKGSLEALISSLSDIKSDKVKVNFVLTGVGNVSNNDVLLAKASNAVILAFNVGQENGVMRLAKHEGVEIRQYSIIYEMIDEVRDVMVGMLDMEKREIIIGHAKVLQIFSVGKRSHVAGCMCIDGRIIPSARVRVKRDREAIFEGVIGSLKRFQNDANEVRETQECGIRVERFNDFSEGDILEFFIVEKIAQQL